MRATTLVDPSQWPDRHWLFEAGFNMESKSETFTWFLQVIKLNEVDFASQVEPALANICQQQNMDLMTMMAKPARWSADLTQQVAYVELNDQQKYAVLKALKVEVKEPPLPLTLPANAQTAFLQETLADYVKEWILNGLTAPDMSFLDEIL